MAGQASGGAGGKYAIGDGARPLPPRATGSSI